MYSNEEKDNKNHLSVEYTTQKKGIGKQSISFVDNRPQSNQIAQLQKAMSSTRPGQPLLQKKENNTGMPDKLKSGIENLSGVDVSDVRVHYNSDKPAQLQAHAYAQGNNIHLGPGQEKHLPHEAWHVVQQKKGRVRPTLQMKGEVLINDDQVLEKEADIMGAKALQMRKIEQGEQINTEKYFSPVVQRVPVDNNTGIEKSPDKVRAAFKTAQSYIAETKIYLGLEFNYAQAHLYPDLNISDITDGVDKIKTQLDYVINNGDIYNEAVNNGVDNPGNFKGYRYINKSTGSYASNRGNGNNALITFNNAGVQQEATHLAGTIIHEASHGSQLSTDDVAYLHDDLYEKIKDFPDLILQNADSWKKIITTTRKPGPQAQPTNPITYAGDPNGDTNFENTYDDSMQKYLFLMRFVTRYIRDWGFSSVNMFFMDMSIADETEIPQPSRFVKAFYELMAEEGLAPDLTDLTDTKADEIYSQLTEPVSRLLRNIENNPRVTITGANTMTMWNQNVSMTTLTTHGFLNQLLNNNANQVKLLKLLFGVNDLNGRKQFTDKHGTTFKILT
ncbi:eCIS core domain-containing protein [Spartinivicinus poritis]|uniref:DUF4157 domain-containing protein n=1 Tax=Spartinivicinus poritis TaxID=2994640 RepID=A0ABT5UES1_9GAMM|nr:DUF4157 domain-containing protein [Spartinivicinus sp. A2-2]MDE1464807.1 DUF4157 domain-containing protein [Spartinivicinus sp. A2-2]